MINLLLVFLFACGDKEADDTAATEEVQEEVQDTASEPEDTATEPEDSGEASDTGEESTEQ